MNKKTITLADIKALQGILKAEPGEKPMTQDLLEEHAEEIRREEEKFKRAE